MFRAYFLGLSRQQRKQYTSNIDKIFFERPLDRNVPTVEISFQMKLPFRSQMGDHSTPPLGQDVGQEHLGWARVKTDPHSSCVQQIVFKTNPICCSSRKFKHGGNW